MAFNAVTFLGLWDAAANRPFLIAGRGQQGDAYLVSAGGSVDIGQVGTFEEGDALVFAIDRWLRLAGAASMDEAVALANAAVVAALAAQAEAEVQAAAAAGSATGALGSLTGATTAANDAAAALASFTASASIPLVADLATLNADLVPAAGSLRQIITVPPGVDDGVYKKIGATTTGSWQWVAPSNGTLAQNVGRVATLYWRHDAQGGGQVIVSRDGNLVLDVPELAADVAAIVARPVPISSTLYWRADGEPGQRVTVTQDGNVLFNAGASIPTMSATDLAAYFDAGPFQTSDARSVPVRFTTDVGFTDLVVIVGLGQSLRRGSFTAPTFTTAARQSARDCAPYVLMPDCGIIVDGRSWSSLIPAYEDIALTPGIYESGFVACLNWFHNRIFADTGKRVHVAGFIEAANGTNLGNLGRGTQRYNQTLGNIQKLLDWGIANGVRITVWAVAMMHGNADYYDITGWHYKAEHRILAADFANDIRLMNPSQGVDPIWFLRQCDVASSAAANSEASGLELAYWHDFGINDAQIELCWENPDRFVSTGTPYTLKVDGTHNDTPGTIWDNETQAEIMADRFMGKPCVPFAIIPSKTRWISPTKFRVVMGLPGYTLVKDLSDTIVDTTLINDTLGWRFDYYGRYPDNTPAAIAPTITSLDVVAQPGTRPMYGYGAVDVTLSGAPLSGDGITRCLHVGMQLSANPIGSPVAPLSWASDGSAPYSSARTPFTVGDVGDYQSGYSDIMANGDPYSGASSHKRLVRPWLMRSLVILP